MRTAIQVVVIRDPGDRRTDVYVNTLRLAFEGSAGAAGVPSGYLAEAVDLGIRVLEPAENITDDEVRRLVRGARHTIVVVIGVSSDLSQKFQEWVGRDNIVCVPPPRELSDGEVQSENATGGVEPAFAPVVTTLRAMQQARRALARRIGDCKYAKSGLKLFISHAKIDGVPMAKSLVGVLRQLQDFDGESSGFTYFYDDEHIEPGTVWRQVLETHVGQSILIALRTEAYESRYWCRREFLLAESTGMPILVVDLRKEQYHDSALLPFDVVPSVRVHDGNLIRIVLHAMVAHLRVLCVQSEAPAGVTVLPHRPSVYSLGGVSRGAHRSHTIAYPGPRLPDAYKRAVRPILGQVGRTVDLVPFDELVSG